MGRVLTPILRNQPGQVALKCLGGKQGDFGGLCAAEQKKAVTLRVVKH